MAKRVLLAGLFHETHTFLEGTTPLADFTLRHGDELLAARGDGSPLAGVLNVADEHGWEVVPTIDLRATPSATADDAVFHAFWSELEPALRRQLARGLDGIYLVLHGAMVTASLHDVEGELIARIRAVPGAASVPICGVLDPHGNISQRSVEQTQGLIAYRCVPHTDAHQAAVDGALLLERIMTSGQTSVCVWDRPAVMWPPTGTATADLPMSALEAQARAIEREDPEIVAVNVFAGFSFADTPDTGVSFSAVAFGDPAAARAQLALLCRLAEENRAAGNVLDEPLETALAKIRTHVARGETPVVLVEPSDNVGGGAPGDGTTLLRTFIAEGFDNAAVVINDPQAVDRLRSLRPGERISLDVGGKGSRLTEGPVRLDVELVRVSDGRFELEDPHSHLASMCGTKIDMGPCAVVTH